MIEVVASAIVESCLNRLLVLEPELTRSLENCKHKVIAVELRDWQHTFALTYVGHQFIVFSQYQEHADCHISASLETLTKLTNPSLLTQLIRQEKLDLEGDLQLAQNYSSAFSNIHIDWAEHLSRYIGDAPAQQVINSTQKAHVQGKTIGSSFKSTVTQLCQDELKVTIHPLELEQYKMHTRHIKNQAAQLEQRIQLLLNR
ncbi:ubiquinone biosynthesis accessory factor UbiJ [Pseudoalteromonas aurantia]|uniref:Ubiquinone biosynthesis accessory factor UbiJ n=1 Tax=Pseudoalteromonas aurantia 208 TaxID=1314867 RepID=A0ABR9EFV7_9GAMM|nr:SCP2 sterol-binding domain-containing protein [Pseudoalteromonas aurantia]MBE0369878.1 yigP [Pseudoalteromonas aurantia 208]